MMQEQQKQAVLMMRSRGMPYAEIADTLMLSPNTVKSFCRRSGSMATPPAESTGRCKNCGGCLPPDSGTKHRIFCSDGCRYAWWNRVRSRKPYRLACYQCGREFISYGNRKRKYCGRECYLLSRYGGIRNCGGSASPGKEEDVINKM